MSSVNASFTCTFGGLESSTISQFNLANTSSYANQCYSSCMSTSGCQAFVIDQSTP